MHPGCRLAECSKGDADRENGAAEGHYHWRAWLAPADMQTGILGSCERVSKGPLHVRAADVNLLKVPEGMDDKKVVLLSDIMPTGWHGARLANVEKGSRVAVWGCGPGAITSNLHVCVGAMESCTACTRCMRLNSSGGTG